MITSLPKAIIFDWDNTLVDSWPAIMEAINQTRVEFGLPTWTLPEIIANCTRAARDSFPEWFGASWKKAYDFYYESFDILRRNREIKIKRGATELLQWLKANNIPAFVVSNKRGDYLRHEIGRVEWGHLFEGVAGSQDAPRDKPAREHVDHVLAFSKLKPDASVWFVGDSEADVLCARNAGCTPVLVGDFIDAQKHGVTLVFDDCQKLLDLLYTLKK